jgi:ribosomal protein S13
MYLYKEKYLPINREIRNSLQSIYGVGKHKSNLIVARIGLGYPFFINNLNLYNFYFLVSSLDC